MDIVNVVSFIEMFPVFLLHFLFVIYDIKDKRQISRIIENID